MDSDSELIGLCSLPTVSSEAAEHECEEHNWGRSRRWDGDEGDECLAVVIRISGIACDPCTVRGYAGCFQERPSGQVHAKVLRENVGEKSHAVLFGPDERIGIPEKAGSPVRAADDDGPVTIDRQGATSRSPTPAPAQPLHAG